MKLEIIWFPSSNLSECCWWYELLQVIKKENWVRSSVLFPVSIFIVFPRKLEQFWIVCEGYEEIHFNWTWSWDTEVTEETERMQTKRWLVNWIMSNRTEWIFIGIAGGNFYFHLGIDILWCEDRCLNISQGILLFRLFVFMGKKSLHDGMLKSPWMIQFEFQQLMELFPDVCHSHQQRSGYCAMSLQPS